MSVTLFILLVLLVIGLLILILGAFNIQWNFFLKALHRGEITDQRIALTFDDGPHPIYTPKVLALLEEYHVQATFFCIGKQIAKHPDLVRLLNDRGHLVGNHSYTHAATIDFRTKAGWLGEIRHTDTAIAECIGRRPRFFRPPYGVTTPHLAQAVKESGHAVIGWRVRPYDTLKRPAERIVRTILKKTKPGDIILLHDTHDRVALVLEQLLPELQKRHFTMVTVDTLIQRNAYA
ncbi:polysaccharide deacetylase family protein [Parapedobacter sp. DT-150]|uniref:polysaccharide deacetylase family protein n=1 Tax=Parapedobacter sp. DT-150 TaxID=3396162 RepID=UPI003F1A6685